MRDDLQAFVSGFPKQPKRSDSTFAGHPIKERIEVDLVRSAKIAIGNRASKYVIAGSAGQGAWTQTPWLVFLDPAVTTSVGRGYYVVYLLSHGGERLYLTIGQGCTILKNAIGLPGAKAELRRRSRVMQSRIAKHSKRLSAIAMDLNTTPRVWRGKLYEAGAVVGREYPTANLPSEEILVDDLQEALNLYEILRREGGWNPDDDIVEEANDDGVGRGLKQAKKYRQHRSIEREPGHSKEVKRVQGTRCKVCDLEMADVYGDDAAGMCDAHHLIPLETLDEGIEVTFDPIKDFAVLCPNCHRAIHRSKDPGDVDALREAIRGGVLSKLLQP